MANIYCFIILTTIVQCHAKSFTPKYCGGVVFPPLTDLRRPTLFQAAARPEPKIPFKVNYFLHPQISAENRKRLQTAIEVVNQKLGSRIKAPQVFDILFRRIRTRNNSCSVATCIDVDVPEEFSHPCFGNFPKKPKKVRKPRDWPTDASEGYTLSIYVMVQNEGTKRNDCNHEADAGPCQFDPATGRPTHGRIYFCTSPKDKVNEEMISDTLLHETLHVMTGDLIGSFFPSNPGMYDPKVNNYSQLANACLNISWVARIKPYTEASSQISKRLRFFTVTKAAREAAVDHFRCNKVKGVELATIIDEDKSRYVNFGHWSQHLFMDEVLSPNWFPDQRLSAMTLGYLNDSTWYEVDMSKAEPLTISRPESNGCEIAIKSCHEILAVANRDKSKIKSILPYCDQKNTLSRCSKDGRTRLMCYNFGDITDNCSVLFPALYATTGYDSAHCDRATTQPNVTKSAGLHVGQCSVCMTAINFPYVYVTQDLQSACMRHECYHLNSTIVFKYKPSRSKAECQFRCRESESNQKKLYQPRGQCNISPNRAKITIVCPDYNDVCQCAASPEDILGPEPDNSASTARRQLVIYQILIWIILATSACYELVL